MKYRFNEVTVYLNTMVVLFLAFSLMSGAAYAWQIPGDVAVCTAANDQAAPQLISDGNGGAIITWIDSRNSNNDIYTQSINSSGVSQWTTDGVAVCTAANSQESPMLMSDGSGGAIITWYDSRNGNSDIYAQSINSSGDCQWTLDGVAVCTAANNQSYPQLMSDDSGGAIIVWSDSRNIYTDIYAQRIDASGVSQWTLGGVAVCTAANGQYDPQLVSDGSGGAIIVWYDQRNSNWDIYAQRIDSSGFCQWTTIGVAICTAASDQTYPQLVSDGSGGAIITWHDYRNGLGDINIYAQRINSSGVSQWTLDGLAVCTTANTQMSPKLVSDDSGGAIITWLDNRNSDWDLYAQRINSSGVCQWTTLDGVAVCTAANDQQYPQLVSDGSGGAIITWQDYRDTTGNPGQGSNIYAQRLDASGSIVIGWPVNGVAICTDTNDQYIPQLVSNSSGGAIITWYDLRHGSSNYDIYAQSVTADGFVPVELSRFEAMVAIKDN